MRTFLHMALGLVAAGLGMQPRPLAAQELTTEQVRTTLVEAGYEVEAPMQWAWLSPPHTTLRAVNHASGHVVLVLIYANQRDAELDSPLVPGFGPTITQDNLALAETTQAELDRWSTIEWRRSVGMLGPTP